MHRRTCLALAFALVPSLAAADEPVPAQPPPPPAEQPQPPPQPTDAPTPPATPVPNNPLEGQPAVRESAAVSYDMSAGVSSPRQMATSNMLMPAGDTEVGGELSYVTADGLEFTDLALLRLSVRRSFRHRVELGVNLEILPKQPPDTDEPVFQGGTAGARIAWGQKWVVNVLASGGPMMGDSGWYWTGALGGETKRTVHETLTFDLAGGASFLRLQDDAGANPWLAEVGVSGNVLLHTPRGEVGFWIGTGYNVPVAHADQAGFDPQTRLDFHLGIVYALIPKWDFVTELQVIDRGDPDDPATQLPILDGGFDQRQVVFGVVHHFTKEEGNNPLWLAI